MILTPIKDLLEKNKTFSQIKELSNNSVEGVTQGSYPFIISSIFQKTDKQILVITDNATTMQELYLTLTTLIDETKICTLPSWDTLPYEFVSPPEHIEKERVQAIYRILKGDPLVVISTVEAILRKVPTSNFFTKKGLTFELDEELPFDDIIETLIEYGYERESKVEAYGQFSVKGSIIDIFLPSYDNPIRLDFFDDSLESIREFEIESQVSKTKHKEITIYTRAEFILSIKEKELLFDIFEKKSKSSKLPDSIVNQLNEGMIEKVYGIEDLFPLIMENESILSYFQKDFTTISIDNSKLITEKNHLDRKFTELYNKKKSETICIAPDELININSFDEIISKSLTIQTSNLAINSQTFNFKTVQGFHGNIKTAREKISEFLENGWKVVITTGFEGQARRLKDLLRELNPFLNFESLDIQKDLNIIVSPFKDGVEFSDEKILILTDQEIFGKKYRQKGKFRKHSKPIESFLDLKVGDSVVHINHGIGLFKGIERMKAGGVERDFFMLEYADGDKLYVPLDQISLVQSYIGSQGNQPKLNTLGRKSTWIKTKEKAKQAIDEVAKELMEIYSKRAALQGFQYPPDSQWQEEFETLFEYEETADQISAIEDVKDDMESSKPMDRLVCGDVGFGKTEVAIRASFKSVMAGKQVAILVPTTVLTMQHYSTFNERFANYPIKVEMISRFRSQAEIKKIKEQASIGEIDIVIGTHAILSKDMVIKNLGLLIIDEEQKFGVKHKEKLKELKSTVDVLALSATPIPRTLHMSMSGIRDLSIISTPPENRQSIETYVLEENPDILREAILAEIEREGQLFYIHNRVQTIDAQQTMLEKLVPEATFATAHGQMGEDELEEVMIDFLKGKYDVLIATTIIESGLDISNANTIIINRADSFGLSQLYQLKGRVGRSNKKAFAYLFYPKHIPLSEEASKRLNVISEYTELGSGFKIAMKDLEIRGSGNILGHEQSGSIMDVGFELYTQMLEDSIKKFKGESEITLFRTPIFIKTSFFIPDDYIFDVKQKIEFYKNFEKCQDEEDVLQIESEMIDRFGNPPVEAKILVEVEKLRAIASKLKIKEIIEDSKSINIKISSSTLIDVVSLMNSISEDKRLSFDPNENETVVFTPNSNIIEKKLSELKKWLQQIY